MTHRKKRFRKKIKSFFNLIINLNLAQARGVVLMFLVITLYFNLKTIWPSLTKGMRVINPTGVQVFLSKDDKLRLKTSGFVYDYAEFVKKKTPEDAVILVPPQGFPWPMTGNVAYFRYFLYPRRLINGDEKETKVDLKKEGVKYVLLAWGETDATEYDYTHGWPKFFLPAKRIIYKKNLYQAINYEVEIVEKDYDPNDSVNVKNWGIIELDQERL